MSAIKLGVPVVDLRTNLVGVATARAEYLGEGASVRVEPPLDKNGHFQPSVWIEESRLTEIDFAQYDEIRDRRFGKFPLKVKDPPPGDSAPL
jgi:hypothetical protein